MIESRGREREGLLKGRISTGFVGGGGVLTVFRE